MEATPSSPLSIKYDDVNALGRRDVAPEAMLVMAMLAYARMNRALSFRLTRRLYFTSSDSVGAG